jgi:hypothetical protein
VGGTSSLPAPASVVPSSTTLVRIERGERVVHRRREPVLRSKPVVDLARCVYDDALRRLDPTRSSSDSEAVDQ